MLVGRIPPKLQTLPNFEKSFQKINEFMIVFLSFVLTIVEHKYI